MLIFSFFSMFEFKVCNFYLIRLKLKSTSGFFFLSKPVELSEPQIGNWKLYSTIHSSLLRCINNNVSLMSFGGYTPHLMIHEYISLVILYFFPFHMYMWTRSVWKISSYFKSLENCSHSFDVTWQLIKGGLIAHV